MPPREEKWVTGTCGQCRRQFSYAARLPRQEICNECYYEDRGDLTGALQEKAWRLGYEHGLAKGGNASETLPRREMQLPLELREATA